MPNRNNLSRICHGQSLLFVKYSLEGKFIRKITVTTSLANVSSFFSTMEKFYGFTWGYLYPVFKLGAHIPYLPKSRGSLYSFNKWQFYSTLHIFSILLFFIGYYPFISFSNPKYIFALGFEILGFFGFPLSIAFNLFIILIRKKDIYSILEYYSKIMENLKNRYIEGRKVKILNRLFYYAVCHFIINLFVSLSAAVDSNLGIINALSLFYNSNQFFLLDLNFCVFVLHVQFLFQCLNGKLGNLERRKKSGLLRSLKFFQKIHNDSSELVLLVEKCFLDSLTTITAVEFVGFVYGFYGIYRSPTFANIIQINYWAWFYICKMIVKLHICSSTTKEVN